MLLHAFFSISLSLFFFYLFPPRSLSQTSRFFLSVHLFSLALVLMVTLSDNYCLTLQFLWSGVVQCCVLVCSWCLVFVFFSTLFLSLFLSFSLFLSTPLTDLLMWRFGSALGNTRSYKLLDWNSFTAGTSLPSVLLFTHKHAHKHICSPWQLSCYKLPND